MIIACTTLCYCDSPIEIALENVAQMGFRNIDFAAVEGWKHKGCFPSDLVKSGDAILARFKPVIDKHQLKIVALNCGLGTSDIKEALPRAEALFNFGKKFGVKIITFGAGSNTQTVAEVAEFFRPIVKLAADYGITVTGETHIGQITEKPQDAVELTRQCPGMFLTLDPSHYHAGPPQGKGFEIVYPFVKHLHIRDAGMSRETLQMPFGTGRIDWAGILRSLRKVGYDGIISMEYIHDPKLDVAAEIRKARAFVEKTWAS